MDDANKNLPIQKVLISGATLSSLINTLNTTTSTTTGQLYGHLSLHTPPLSDDTPPPPSLIATITSTTPSTRHPIIGHFSSRRLSPLRPSLLDHSHSHSHTSATPIFLLLTTSPANPTHTYSYRAYYFQPDTASYEAVSLEVVNIGPGFRGQYSGFSPKSGLPWLAGVGGVGSPMREDGGKSLIEMKRVGNDVKELKGYVDDGYDIDSLFKLVGNDAVVYMSGVEDLYENMLAKLNGLARVVEVSSSKVLDLENHNTKLRRKVAGIE